MLKKKIKRENLISFISIYIIFSILLLLAISAMEWLHLKEDMRTAAYQMESIMPPGYHERFRKPQDFTESDYISFLNDVKKYSIIRGIDSLMVVELIDGKKSISLKIPKTEEEMFSPYRMNYRSPFTDEHLGSIIDSLAEADDPGSYHSTIHRFSGKECIVSVTYNRDYYDNPYAIIVGRSLESFLSSSIRRCFSIVGIVLLIQSLCILAFYSIFTRLKEKEMTIQKDDLTGFYTRKFLPELEKIISEREDGAWGIIYMDLDRLKTINDSLGHDAGDRYIASFASMIRNTLRNVDYVIRMGGDEFLIVAPIKEAAHLDIVIERLKKHNTKGLSYSMGWEFLPGGSDSKAFQDLLKRVDTSMYEDKKQRKTGRTS